MQHLAVSGENRPPRGTGLGVACRRGRTSGGEGLVICSLLAQLIGERFPPQAHLMRSATAVSAHLQVCRGDRA
jgi:hypothetical protein